MEIVAGPDKIQEKNSTFERLVAEYQTQLLRLCYLQLQDEDQARDAVQETFLKAYRNWDTFRGEAQEKTWLIKIAVNTCRDLRKSAWFRHVDRRVTPEELPLSVTPYTLKEESLVQAVMKLPEKLREATVLYYYQGLNVNDIANALGISHSSVSGRLKRAREELRKSLEGMDFP